MENEQSNNDMIPTPNNPRTHAQGRDPRDPKIDPQPGDVLEIGASSPIIVFQRYGAGDEYVDYYFESDYSHELEDFYTSSCKTIVGWQTDFASAEVIHRAD